MVTCVIFILVCLLPSIYSVKEKDSLIIETTCGQVKGRISMWQKHQVREWLGIPYAEPPEGELRFKRPVNKAKWKSTLEATKQPNACFQGPDPLYQVLKETYYMWRPTVGMSEDCLYLNIHAPTLGIDRTRPLSTLVWIHGGGFYTGSASLEQYNPLVLVAEQNIIVVSIQYRLGAFGLLYFDDERIPGNMGLLDQAMALQWIYDNIAAFGGNNNDITIMGNSAGAMSVGYHMISKRSRDLFQKAIMQSGSPLCLWGFGDKKEQLSRSKHYVSYLGCLFDDVTSIHKCLMKKSPQKILAADKTIVPLLPTVDNFFLDMSPREALDLKLFSPKPLLSGMVKKEGMPFIIFFLQQIRKINYFKFTKDDFEAFISIVQHYSEIPTKKLAYIGQAYKEAYTTLHEKNIEEAASQLFGDYLITCGSIAFYNKIRSAGQPTFRYYFNHRSNLSLDPLYTNVMHGSELQYQFGRPYLKDKSYNHIDRKISSEIMEYWANFVKNGVPSKDWKPNDHTKNLHKVITNDKKGEVIKEKEDLCELWGDSYASILPAKHVKGLMKTAVFQKLGKFFGRLIWFFISGRFHQVE